MEIVVIIRLENANDCFKNYVACKNCGHLIKFWPLKTAFFQPRWYHAAEIYNPRLRGDLLLKKPLRCFAKGCRCEKPEPEDGTIVYFENRVVYPIY